MQYDDLTITITVTIIICYIWIWLYAFILSNFVIILVVVNFKCGWQKMTRDNDVVMDFSCAGTFTIFWFDFIDWWVVLFSYNYINCVFSMSSQLASASSLSLSLSLSPKPSQKYPMSNYYVISMKFLLYRFLFLSAGLFTFCCAICMASFI